MELGADGLEPFSEIEFPDLRTLKWRFEGRLHHSPRLNESLRETFGNTLHRGMPRLSELHYTGPIALLPRSAYALARSLTSYCVHSLLAVNNEKAAVEELLTMPHLIELSGYPVLAKAKLPEEVQAKLAEVSIGDCDAVPKWPLATNVRKIKWTVLDATEAPPPLLFPRLRKVYFSVVCTPRLLELLDYFLRHAPHLCKVGIRWQRENHPEALEPFTLRTTSVEFIVAKELAPYASAWLNVRYR